MKLRGLRAFLLALLPASVLTVSAMAACPVPPRGRPLPLEATPTAIPWQPWQVNVDAVTERMRQTDVSRTRIVFLGDSVTEWWQAQIFQQFYGHRGALNLGIGGDATQGTLWRLEHGHWPAGLRPAVIVLLIGTNNIGHGASVESTAFGISTVIARLQQLSPASRILLLGILPRGPTVADPMRPLVAGVNRLIAACADGRRVFYSDPGQFLVDGEGNLADYIASDRLHPTMVGYAILSTALEAPLRQLLAR